MFFSLLALTLASSAIAVPAGTTPSIIKGLQVAPTAYPSGATVHAPVNATNELPLPEGQIKWIGQIEENGPNVTLTGTHYEVRMKIRDLGAYWQQPGYVWPNDTLAEDAAELETRSTQRDPWSYCNDRNKPFAQAKATRNNIQYLRTHYGNAYCGVNPHQCGRFSCSYNAAILLCNDNNFELVIPCTEFYNHAMYTWNSCNQQDMGMNGQTFYINPAYNVILAGTNPGRSC